MSTRSATIIRQTTYWGEQAETEELMRFYHHAPDSADEPVMLAAVDSWNRRTGNDTD